MTVKELKTSLREGRRVSDRIKQLQESAERAYANITSATQKISDSGVHSDKMRDAMAEYVAYSEEIYEEIARLQKIRRTMLLRISKLNRYELQTVLHLYYIDCLSWEQVKDKMNYSLRWTQSLHGIALKTLADIETQEEEANTSF